MLQLADIRDYIETLDIAENYYVGKLDNKKEKSIGVYQLKTSGENVAMGGIDNTKTLTKTVSILIHWNKNAKETEFISNRLYIELLKIKEFYINSYKINYIELLVPESIDVGTDDNNVYERVIQATFYYSNVDTMEVEQVDEATVEEVDEAIVATLTS